MKVIMTKLRRRAKRTGKKRTGNGPVLGGENDEMEESKKEFSAVVESEAHSDPDEDRFLTGDEKVFNAGIALAEYCTRHLEPFMEFLSCVRDEELTLDGLDKCCSFVVSNEESDDSGVGFSGLDNSGAGVKALGSPEKISFVKECSYQGSANEELVEVDYTTPGGVKEMISEDSSSKEFENSTESICEDTCSGSPGPTRRLGYRKLSSDESDEDDQLNEDNSRANLIPFSPDITSFRAVKRPQDQLPTQRSLLQQFEALAVDSNNGVSLPDETEELSREDAGTSPDDTKSNTEVGTTSDEDIKVLLVNDSKDSAKVASKRPKSQTRKATGSYPLTRKHRHTELSLCETSSPSCSTARSARRRSQAAREESDSKNLNQSGDVVILSEITRSKSFNSNKESPASKPKKAATIGTARRSSRKRSNKSPRRAIPSDTDDDIKVISPAPLAKKMKVVKARPSRSSRGRYSLRSKT